MWNMARVVSLPRALVELSDKFLRERKQVKLHDILAAKKQFPEKLLQPRLFTMLNKCFPLSPNYGPLPSRKCCLTITSR